MHKRTTLDRALSYFLAPVSQVSTLPERSWWDAVQGAPTLFPITITKHTGRRIRDVDVSNTILHGTGAQYTWVMVNGPLYTDRVWSSSHVPKLKGESIATHVKAAEERVDYIRQELETLGYDVRVATPTPLSAP